MKPRQESKSESLLEKHIEKNHILHLRGTGNLSTLQAEIVALPEFLSKRKEIDAVFIRNAAVTRNSSNMYLLKILASLKIKFLTLMNCQLKSEHIDLLAENKDIRELRLPENSIDDTGTETILKKMPELTLLDLSGNKVSIKGIKLAKNHKTLKQLYLNNTPCLQRFTQKDAEEYPTITVDLVELASEEKVEHYDLENFLQDSPKNKLISDFKYTKKIADELAKGVDEKHPNTLHCRHLSEEHIKAIPQFLGENPKINEVVIRNFPFNGDKRFLEDKEFRNDDALLKNLASTKLKSLQLINCNIGQKEAKILSTSTSLQYLYLPMNHLGDEGFESVVMMPTLRYLSLGGNEFKDKRITKISNLREISGLELRLVRRTFRKDEETSASKCEEMPNQKNDTKLTEKKKEIVKATDPLVIPAPLLQLKNENEEKKKPSENNVINPVNKLPVTATYLLRNLSSSSQEELNKKCKKIVARIERHLLNNKPWKLRWFGGADFIAEDKSKYAVPHKILSQLTAIQEAKLADKKNDKTDKKVWIDTYISLFKLGQKALKESKSTDKKRKAYYSLFDSKNRNQFIEQFVDNKDKELIKKLTLI